MKLKKILKLMNGGASAPTKEAIYEKIEKKAEKHRADGETKEQAFTKFVTTTEKGRQLLNAYRAAPSAPAKPVVITTKRFDDASPAYRAICAKAAELEQSEPHLTEAQAFTKVFTDPENAVLKKRYNAEVAMRRTSHAA